MRWNGFIRFLQALENFKGAESDAPKKQSINREITNRISAEIRFPREVEDAQNAAQQEQIGVQRRVALWTGLAFVAAAGAFGAALWQGYESRETLHDSQRPWVVALTAEYANPEPGAPAPLGPLINFKMKNFGNSVATEGWLFARDEPNDPAWLNSHWRIPCEEIDNFKSASEDQRRKTSLAGNWPIGFVLAPGDDVPEIVGAAPVYDDAEVAAIRKRGNSPAGVYIVACIEYLDQFRISHVTTTCFNARDLSKCNGFQSAN